jgi:uncharacterized repeat protein (TIGR01451 family)
MPSYQQPPASLAAPATDFDDQPRPTGAGFDSGADELVAAAAAADLSITKTDGVTSVTAGGAVNYSIVVNNAGPSAVTGATVTDNFPVVLTVNSWTCTASGGSSCAATGTGNNRTGTVNLLSGGSATFTASTTLSASATGSLANTASVAAPVGTTDPNTANNSATDTDTITPAASAPILYMTLVLDTTLPGASGPISVANDDAVSFDGTNYSMLFDASDVLPTSITGSSGINGFVRLDATHALLSFTSPVSGVPGIAGTVDDSDIVLFTGTLGAATSGTFSMWFHGSDVSLTTFAESVNAFTVLPDGVGGYDVVVSTAGGINVPGISGTTTSGSDLFRCSGGTRGTNTSCTWSWYFDGSDVGLSTFVLENINGVAVAGDGKLYLTTLGNFSVPGVSGTNKDVFVFTPTSLGATTAGTYSSTLFFTGGAHGLTGVNSLNGIGLP